MNKLGRWSLAALMLVGGVAVAQSSGTQNRGTQEPQATQSAQMPDENQAPPRSDDGAGQSSSKDNRIDLSPPKGDALTHPNSSIPLDVTEMKPYDPHRADKNVEIGDYYFKRKNYQAAASRYREAMEWMSNDAIAAIKLATCLEKLGQAAEARDAYQEYLNILPNGPLAEEAKKALSRLPASPEKKASVQELKVK